MRQALGILISVLLLCDGSRVHSFCSRGQSCLQEVTFCVGRSQGCEVLLQSQVTTGLGLEASGHSRCLCESLMLVSLVLMAGEIIYIHLEIINFVLPAFRQILPK